jgi:hypothetical protein
VTQYEVIPHVGVGPVRLGMSREEVRRLMPGEPSCFRTWPYTGPEADTWHDGGFQVHYAGEPPAVAYILLCRGLGVRALYRGLSVFDADAAEVVRLLSREASFDDRDPELGYTYVFPALELSVWRPVVPGPPGDEDGRHFSSIGIGVRGYHGRQA